MEVADQFWGDRYGSIRDPFGHNWSLATHLRDMTPEEIQAAMAMPGRAPDRRRIPCTPTTPGSAGPGRAVALLRLGRGVALAGVVLPLLLIGGMKFTAVEIEALRPLIAGTPWLAWLYPAFGEAGRPTCSASSRSPRRSCCWPRRCRRGRGGRRARRADFATTCSLMLALPICEPTLGFPRSGPSGSS